MTDRMDLPSAAGRWLERALPPGAATPTHAAVAQRGSLESDGRWLTFRSEATYGARPLAFEWRARLRIMFGLWAIATDGHAAGEGWGGAKLWGLKSIGGRTGPEVLAMQLIRNLAELVWLPDLALADPALRWVEAGDDAFELRADAAAHEVTVRFDLDETGDIVRASSPARPLDVPEGFEDTPWRYDLTGHRDLDGFRVPAEVVATYALPEGPWEYFRAEVTDIERFHGTD